MTKPAPEFSAAWNEFCSKLPLHPSINAAVDPLLGATSVIYGPAVLADGEPAILETTDKAAPEATVPPPLAGERRGMAIAALESAIDHARTAMKDIDRDWIWTARDELDEALTQLRQLREILAPDPRIYDTEENEPDGTMRDGIRHAIRENPL
jgi:hypothetical protein